MTDHPDHHDLGDLGELADSALVRALRAPGSAAELAGEEEVLAAYRRHHGVRRRGPGRVVGRIGAGGTALVAALALTGGVAAAAYQQALPDRVQAFAHDALGGLGVPPARERGDGTGRAGADPLPQQPTTTPSGSAGPGSAPSSTGAEPGPADRPPGKRGHATVRPHEPSTGPAVVRVSLSERTVDAGGSTTITARVRDAALEPVVGQEVTLWQRPAGGAWTVAGSAPTDAEGWVAITTEPVTASTDLRLEATVADGLGDSVVLQSEPRRVAVRPVLDVSASGRLLTVRVSGARPGDPVWVARRGPRGRLLRVATVSLDEQGVATADLSRFRGTLRVRVRLAGTPAHLGAERWIVLRLGRVPQEPEPSASPEPTPSAQPTP